MSNFLLLFACFVAGILLRRYERTPIDAHKTLNAIVVNISLPALALVYLRELKWTSSVAGAVLMPWAVFVLAVFVFVSLGRRLAWRKETVGATVLVCGLGNTSFVGIPVLDALYGKEAIPLGLLIDQAGSYLIISTLGIVVAAYFAASTEKLDWGAVGRKVVTFPPFVAMVLAIVLLPVEFPLGLGIALKRLADTVTPLALLSVGMQISLRQTDSLRVPLTLGLGYKLVVVPLLVAGTYMLSGAKLGMQEMVVISEAAMGPSIGASIVAAQYGLQPRLVALMVGLGIPLSMALAPMWYYVLRASI